MKLEIFHGVLISFLFGVGLGTLFPFGLPGIVWLLLIAFAAMLVVLRVPDASYARSVAVGCLFITAAAFGLLRIEVTSWSIGASSLESFVGEEIVFTGIVSKEPDIRAQTQQLYVTAHEETLLVTTDKFFDISYGDEVTVSGMLSLPESFETELGREFRYDTYLLAKGIEYTVSFAEVEVLSSGHGNSFISMLLSGKQYLVEGIDSVLTEPQAGLGKGLLLGIKQALGDELEETFRAAGIVHIVVLSGYNVMLIISFTLFILSFFLGRRLRIISGMVAVVAFALLVGLSATVVRASAMALLLLGAQLLGRTYDIMRALLFAATAMVFVHPYILLYDIGFQFSFMATLGLVVLVPHFEVLLLGSPTAVGLREYLLSTVATQIAVLPLLLYYIGEVSLVAVLVNLLVLPVVPLAMLTTFLAGVISHVSLTLAIPCAYIAQGALAYIISVATWCAALPFATVQVFEFSPVWVGVMYVFLGYVVYRVYTRTSSSYGEWVVEEEYEVKEKAAVERRSTAASTDTPAFFR